MNPWEASPSESRWYGEIIFDLPDGGDCGYNYGYSSSETRPALSTLTALKPEGYVILKRTIRMTPGHPRYRAPKEETS